MAAIWKPLGLSIERGWWESYLGEVFAYRLDLALGTDWVPPTVKRSLGGPTGSMQFWLEDHVVLVEAPQELEALLTGKDWARIQLFDCLVNNPDRNQGNVLIHGTTGRVALIDHSRALPFHGGLRTPRSWQPKAWDRDLALRMARLDALALRSAMGDVMTDRQIRRLLKRRDVLLKRMNQDIKKRGAAAFF